MVSVARPVFAHTDPGTPEETWRARPEWGSARPLALPDHVRRVVVVAPHPDDETLAAGGLMATAHAAGVAVDVVLLTDGEQSHPRSVTVTPLELAARRVEESRAALSVLAPGARLHRVGLPDGALDEHAEAMVAEVVRVVGEAGRETLLVAPWRRDGHSDHDAAGLAAGIAARRTDATLWEYPVWLWHWCDPADAPWPSLRVLPLGEEVRRAKARAVALHRTQLEPLSPSPGDEALLHDGFIAHFERATETFVLAGLPLDHALDRVHEDSEDPWQVRSSWYEERKRAVTLAALPRRSFGRGLEIGGSVGALADALAARCRELVVVDESRAAVHAAREALDAHDHVAVLRHSVPEEWPPGLFDVVVVSEVGYFLGPVRLRRLARQVEACLAEEGVVVLCHWRHHAVGWPLDGDRVHEIWRSESTLPVAVSHVEEDFRLEVLTSTKAHRQADA
ncbi:bifunctional PIG-L family deacetylase/class I SAM-dependent methyltransferase [Terrabacter sp. AAH1]